MRKLREWMHGQGRNLVMAVVAIVAFAIVAHYFVVERGGQLGDGIPDTTATPAASDDTKLGGDSILAPQATADNNASDDATASDDTASDDATASSGTVTIGLAGDICLDDRYAVMQHLKSKGKLSGVIDKKLIQKMNAYDVMVINNEFSISNQGSPMEGKAFTFRSRPENLKYLKKLGIDVAGLANNHVYDYGRAAFFDTIRYLKKAGIKTTGAGKNSAAAKKPAYITVNGKTIAVVAASRAEKNIMTPGAGKNSPGVFRTYDDTQYVKQIKKAKKKADFVIAYVHWGTEYSTQLETAQVQQAKDYINAGADAVVGAHTHCLQGIGYYKGKPIFYSLGNFWFNSKTLYTTVVELKISADGKLSAKMQPCLQQNCETRLLTSKRKIKEFVSYVNKISTNAKLTRSCQIKKTNQ